MIKKVLLGFVALIVLLAVIVLGGGMLLERNLVVSTEQRIKASPAQALPLLTSQAGLAAWWKSELDAMGYVVKKKSGPDEGVGMVVTFESKAGQVFETWTLREVSASAPTRVIYEINFAGMMLTTRTISLTPGSFEGSDARWHEVADIGNPLVRWMMKLT